jgi:hypothetical protein
MVTKKTLNFVILSFMALFVIMASGFSADVYVPYKTVFSTSEVPSDVYVSGYACSSAACTSVDTSSSIELYSGNAATTCWANYNAGIGGSNDFFSCMDDAKLNSDYQDISSNGDYIVVKYDSTNSFGYLTYFSASSDSYFVKYDRINDFNCNYSTCFDNNYRNLEFVKGVDAIAEIGNINIENVENPNYPVQVVVPVEISETVCSAYQFSNPTWWRANIPSGYSDFSADTDVKLTIKNDDTNVEYFNKRISTSIFSDDCTSLSSFSWTPSATLENTRVEFKFETEVVDNQVVSSIKDYAYAYETIYPQELESTCYARIEDFMLSNDNSFDLSSKVTQIQVGEDLFANFKTGAFRDELASPMNFDYNIYFDNQVVISKTGLNSGNSLKSFSEDLTSSISGLSAGSHEVKVVVIPNGENCDVSSDVTQIQNLIITEPETYDVSFRVLGTSGVELSGAKVNFDSMELLTGVDGEVKFTQIDSGFYNYFVSYAGYETKSGSVNVGSDIMITITLSEENSAPVVNFPAEFSDYYTNVISLDVEDYVVDYNELFSGLDVVISKVSGDSSFSYNSGLGLLTFTSSGKPETSTFKVLVKDSFGAESFDTFKVIFVDNSAPVIVEFSADEDDGESIFTTNFNVRVSDVENDDLVCSINFGDGDVTDFVDCSDLDRIAHSFDEAGNYNVVLTVKDSFGNVVDSSLRIYVYTVEYKPYIVDFDLVSSNGNIVPSDLTLSWSAAHEKIGNNIYCELFVNGVSYTVDCDGSKTLSGFDIVGDSIFKIVVKDDLSQSDNEVISRTFESEPVVIDYKPFITSFDLDSSNGIYVPTDLTFDYVVGHENNEQIVCMITINSVDSSIPCTLSSFDLDNYARVGLGTFVLTVTDLDGDSVSKIITRSFEKEPVVIDYKPFISSFGVDSSNGIYVPTDLSFDYVVGHENNEQIVCNLFINNDNGRVVDCDGDFDLNNYNISGNSVFRLVVSEVYGSDSVSAIISRNFENEPVVIDYKPFITSFDLDSSNGIYVSTDLSFDYVVGHENNEQISCMISVNSVSYVVGCDSDFDLSNYNVVGLGTFVLTVTDLDGDSVSRTITKTFENEPIVIDYKPFITSFDLASSNGIYVPTDLSFDYVVGHENGESIYCDLYVNSNMYNIDCNDSFDLSNFGIVGLSTFKLVVTEVFGGDRVEAVISRAFENEPVVIDYKPFITSFDLVSSNGNYVSTDLSFDYVVGHENNEQIMCKLFVNGQSQVIDCYGSFEILGFSKLGDSEFKLEVSDLDGDVVESVIFETFMENIVDMSDLGINLIVDEVLELYEFEFSIEIENESMARRLVGLRPEIICGGSRAVLSDMLSKEMASGIYSSSDNNYVFDFELDTRDFNLHINPGSCELKVVLVDNYGASVSVSEDVRFKFADKVNKIMSIRGNGLDVMNYMQTALLGNVERGYNDVQFNVYNRENVAKKLSVTLTSPDLGISFAQEISVEAGEYTYVEVPLFVKTNTEPGMYPVKYSVNYGTEKYSRYSYIKIE